MNRLTSLLLILCVVATVYSTHYRYKRIVGGQKANPPSSQGEPTVFVYKEDHEAVVVGTKLDDGRFAFRGIRYAEPPVDKYRFQRARKLRLEGQVQATEFGPPCVQPSPSDNDKVIGSEDCLFLNVFVPVLPTDEDKSGIPVLVWIHGGGFRRGSASQYDPRPLVQKGIIVVTIQYRLGSLGFLSASSKDLPGNAGLFDMMLSLNWVKDYISFFGGNPSRVMAFGQGSGAVSAFFLAMSRITQGYLSGILAMSGSALSSFAIDHNPLATAKDLAKRNNCPEEPVLEMVTCLQELPVETLIKADSGLEEYRLAAQGFMAGLTGMLGAAPVVEGQNDGRSLPGFIENSPQESLKLGEFPDIPLLAGIVKDETSTALNGRYFEEVIEKSRMSPEFWNDVLQDLTKYSGIGLFSNVTSQWLDTWSTGYRSLLVGSSEESGDKTVLQLIEATGDALFNVQAFQSVQAWSKKAKSFLYSFEQKSSRKTGSQFLTGLPLADQRNIIETNSDAVGHGDDLMYLFDIPSERGGNATGRSLVVEEDEKAAQDVYTDMISNFLLTGSPVPSSRFTWPVFTTDASPYLSVSSKPKMNNQFRYCQMALWTGITSHLQSTACKGIKGVEQLTENFSNVASGVVSPLKNISDSVGGFIKPPSSLPDSVSNVINPFGNSGESQVKSSTVRTTQETIKLPTPTTKTTKLPTSTTETTKLPTPKTTKLPTPTTKTTQKTTTKKIPINIPNLNPLSPLFPPRG